MTAGDAPLARPGALRSQRAGPMSGVTVELAVVIGLCLLLALLVAVPLIAVGRAALADADGVSWRALATVLGSRRIISNTIYVALAATLLSLAIGGALALILVRIETPGRRLLEALVTLPLYLTPLLTAVAWSWLGSPRGGLINVLWREGLGWGERLVNLQSAEGVIFVAALAYAPLPFLLIGGALRGMDPALEDSARVQGGTPAAVFRRITLPLVLPAMLASALLVLVQCMGLFSVPAVLGMPSGFYVAGTEIYRLLNNYPPRTGQAAAWGLLLLMTTAILVTLQAAVLGRHSFTTITGKAFRPRPFELGRARYVLAGLAWLYVAAAVVLPVLTLLWAALVNFITVDFKLMHFDGRHFAYVLFEYPKTFIALGNSLLLGASTASFVCLIGLVTGWVLVRTRSPMRGVLDQLGMAPLATPPMVLALGILWTYVGGKVVAIYGTLWILLLAYVTHVLPFGVRAASSALRQLHPELEDAARVGGAGWFATLRLIVLPLTRPTLVATWTLLFIFAMQEVSSSILLYSSRSIVLSVAVFDLWEAGNVSPLTALSVMQLAITFLMLAVLVRTRHREVLV